MDSEFPEEHTVSMFKVDPEDGDRMFSETSISILKTVRSHNIEHYAVNNTCRCENMQNLRSIASHQPCVGFRSLFLWQQQQQ